MKRVLEKNNMEETKIILAYDNLKTLDLVNCYFLNRALDMCPSGKILDIGCGTGKMLKNIQGNYEKQGLDISRKLIKQARQQDSNSRYDIGDSNSLPYDARSFDLVMCHSVLHHLANPSRTIKEIIRVAKPEGAIFIRDLIRPTNEEVLQRLLNYLSGHYDKQNKILFENSLRSSFTHDEWKGYFPEGIDVSNILFYNVAEKFTQGIKVDLQKRKSRGIEFAFARLIGV